MSMLVLCTFFLMLNKHFSRNLVFGGSNFRDNYYNLDLWYDIVAFCCSLYFLLAIRKILKLEEPICLFAGTARKGGSWCPTPQPVLGLEEPREIE